jgi:hypothetical protein
MEDQSQKIKEELAFLVKDAKDQLEANIQLNPEQRNRLCSEHQSTMGNIHRLAGAQFLEELKGSARSAGQLQECHWRTTGWSR